MKKEHRRRTLRLIDHSHKPTSYERILSYIEKHGCVSMLDGKAVRTTAITQRCNEMKRAPKRYRKYLRGRRIETFDGRYAIYLFKGKK